MTYTISTEPVTEEHIGRRVLVFELSQMSDEVIHEAILTQVHKTEFDYQLYRVSGRPNALQSAVILIVEN